MSKEERTKEYIQIGVTALRDPETGDFLPSVPLYIKATPEAKASEEKLHFDIAKILAEKMGEYKKGLHREGITAGE